MHADRTDEYLGEFRDFCLKQGFPEEQFLSRDNLERFVETAVDAYSEYPLHLHVFDGAVDTGLLTRMMVIDMKSRLDKTVGLCTGGCESVMLVEAPMTKKTGVLEYIREIDIHSLRLLIRQETLREEHFESYALKKRKPYMDDRTWYIYIFATKRAFQRQGHGKKLMHLMRSFADAHDYHICLETNKEANVAMYEAFGFQLMETTVYHHSVDHYVLRYGA